MTLDSKIKSTTQGKLLDIAKTVDLNTVQHSWEIQKDRYNDIKINKENATLKNQWFWTADFPLYTMEKGQAVLYMADRKHNLVFQNLETAVEQLKTDNNYFPKDSDIGSVIDAKTTLKTKLSDLKLERLDSEWSYFEIKTNDYSNLNKSQRALAERVHGKGTAFARTMKMLNKNKIETTRIYVLNPEYVKNTLGQTGKKSLARVSALIIFNNNSNFDASNRNVDSDSRRLRGVLSKNDENKPGGWNSIMGYYDAILSYSQRFVPSCLWREYSDGLNDVLKR
ncbi:MAG: hypothetical protein ACP5NV_06180 [Candidatus Woesearchaeota archaeon]